jgi:peptidoglycan L-alanyl-D-glutamate endopeptidase CwlK
MPTFSERSLRRLADCHPDLQKLFQEVIRHVDCTVLVGFRNKEDQETAFETGHSQKHWPESNHNKFPSVAIDVAPYPVDWDDWMRWYTFAGYVRGMADQMGIKIRSGLDWSNDFKFHDQRLNDGPHFELLEP